jgi:hypothetical protein
MLKRSDIVWRDNFDADTYMPLLVFVFITILALVFYIISKDKVALYVFTAWVLLTGYIYFIIRSRFIIVKTKGLWIGDLTVYKDFMRKSSVKVKKRKFFIKWEDVKSITFTNKVIHGINSGWIKHFIIIKTNNGNNYSWYVFRFNELIKILKKLGKYKLLTKDSRYR